jgi:hypothetical protein
MNLHELLGNTRVFEQLNKIDVELSRQHRTKGCSFCGGKLHASPYTRKPRGALVAIPDCFKIRFSFCCSICRKRSVPISCLFFGRRVYFGCVIILLTGILQGFTAKSMRDLSEQFQVSKRTLRRWLWFFKEIFPKSNLWQRLRGRLSPHVACAITPLGVLQDFGEARLFEACCFLISGLPP